MSKPPNNRQNAFHSSRSAGPKSRGVPELKFRYRLTVEDDQGNIEGVVYANTRIELDAKLDELESRDRLSPPEIDPTQHRAAKRGAAASARSPRG